jgi:3-oxoacyl-[acyl-carrier-protein] synthase III
MAEQDQSLNYPNIEKLTLERGLTIAELFKSVRVTEESAFMISYKQKIATESLRDLGLSEQEIEAIVAETSSSAYLSNEAKAELLSTLAARIREKLGENDQGLKEE